MRLFGLSAIAVGWSVLFATSLWVAKLDLGYWAVLCGPWGCLPETAPLISVHLMWLVLIGGFLLLSPRALAPLRSRGLWSLIAAAAFSGWVFVVGLYASEYLLRGGQLDSAGQFVKLICYQSAMLTDQPWLQIAVPSLANAVLYGKPIAEGLALRETPSAFLANSDG